MKRLLWITLALVMSLCAYGQTTDKLYKEGKKLYDAEKYTEAFPKLKAAAEKGHKKAQYRVGRCYAKGRGVKEDDRQAVVWYQKSANQGYAKAQYRLGKCYLKGKGVTADKEKAKKLLKKAISDEKKGQEILDELRKERADGDEDAKAILTLIGK